MVEILGKHNVSNAFASRVSFKESQDKEKEEHAKDKVLYSETKKHPITTAVKIQADKFTKAFTTYPKKGMSGSKNANFYEFLTMGMVPYLAGSAAMIGVFNLASKFFDTPGAVNSSKLGKRMGIGVVLYGLFKVISRKFIEKPVKWRYGIDVNLPYKKKIDELPEESNKDNLISYEYHKVFESVDFPRYDLLYNNEEYGDTRNAYFDKVAKKMGYQKSEFSDQQTKDKIREKVVQTRLFSTLSSYLWAATGVAIAAQKPWESFVINPKIRINNFRNHIKVANAAKQASDKAVKNVAKYDYFIKDFGTRFVTSVKELVNKGSKSSNVAGRILLGSAVGMTLLGNFMTLKNFNNNRGNKSHGTSPLIDESKEKVVC